MNAKASSAYLVYVLALLFVLKVAAFVDRQILSILVEPIKQELGVSDTAMGFLSGAAFAIFFAFAVVPLARLADRVDRIWVISAGVALWSLLTAVSGLVRNFGQLALARAGVAVGEASLIPAAHSLIADLFPRRHRATALAIFNVGTHVGVGTGFFLGGWLLERYGWRAAFLAVGAPGLLLALVFRLSIKEIPRGEDGGGEAASLRAGLRVLGGLRSYRHLSLGAAFYGFGAYAVVAWIAVFFLRVHGAEAGPLGARLGALIGVGGLGGATVGGILADRLARRDERWLAWVPAGAQAAAAPFLVLALLAPSASSAFLCLAPALFLVPMLAGPLFAAAQGLAPRRMRALASALLIFSLNLLGLSLGPLAIGAASDFLTPWLGPHAIRYALLLAAAATLWSSFHFLQAARTLRQDLARV